jgi:hypothetical protein
MKEFISNINVTLGHLQARLLKIHLSLPTLQPPHLQKLALDFMLGSKSKKHNKLESLSSSYGGHFQWQLSMEGNHHQGQQREYCC